MLKVFLLVSIVFIASCDGKNSPKTEAREIKSCDILAKENMQLRPKTDSIALGFVLGQEEKDIEAHIVELIAQNKLREDVTWNLGILGEIYGWGYDLFLNDSLNTKYETLIGYSTYKGKLASLTIFGNTKVDIQILVNFLSKRLGEYSCTKLDGNKTDYLWFDGYKQVILTNRILPFVIEYTDIRVAAEKILDKEKADSIHDRNLRQKAERSKDDFK